MGKTEKIVVLSVLFAIVVLFVWSLDQGDAGAAGPTGGGDPVADRSGGAANGGQANGPGDGQPLVSRGGAGVTGLEPGPVVQARPFAPAEGQGGGPLLNADVEFGAAAADGARGGPSSRGPGVVLRAEWDLVTLVGLESTVDPEVFVLSARTNETWESLAERLYGDASKARLLRRSNEGTTLGAGTALLVPAIDRLPKVPDVREVEVLEGEGLWHVAKRALGSGVRWKELHDANRDRISDPDHVKPGTLLRLPSE